MIDVAGIACVGGLMGAIAWCNLVTAVCMTFWRAESSHFTSYNSNRTSIQVEIGFTALHNDDKKQITTFFGRF